MRPRWAPALVALALAGCGAPAPAAQPSPSVRVFAASATETPRPLPTQTPLPAAPAATIQPTAAPVITPGPIAYVVTFATERRDYTLHVGDAIRLDLTSGPSGDWISGVDDARVLAPASPASNGIYQAMTTGTTLLTAHVLYGCGNVTPLVPCKPERGLWYQTRVYVLP